MNRTNRTIRNQKGIRIDLTILMLLGMVFLTAPALHASAQTVETMKIGALVTPENPDPQATWRETAAFMTVTMRDTMFSIVPLQRDEIADALKSKRVKFIIADPLTIVQLSSDIGLDLLVARTKRFNGRDYNVCGGTLFCNMQRTDLNFPRDLLTKKIAAVDPSSLAGWLSVKRDLLHEGMTEGKDYQVEFVGSADKVAQAVLTGRADAGALEAGTLERLTYEGKIFRDVFRVIWFKVESQPEVPTALPFGVSTELYPEWILATPSSTSYELFRRVTSVLYSMPPPTEILDVPVEAGWTFVPSFDMAHRCMQDLKLPPYEHFGEVTFRQVLKQYKGVISGALAVITLLILIIIYITRLNRLLSIEIRERMKAEESLRESVKRFEHIAACSADWIWEMDETGRYTYSSSIVEHMLGYKPEEVIGRNHYDFLAKAEKERLTAMGKTTMAPKDHMFRERYKLLTKDGRVVIHESTAEPITDIQGKFSGYRGVNRDITSQVRFVRLKP